MNKIENLLTKHLYPLFFKRKEAQLVANNTLWIIFDKMIKLGLGMITGVWVARYLGPENFGTLTYLTSFIVLFTPFTNFSIDSLIVRDLATRPEQKNEILGSGFLLKIIASFIGMVAAVFIMYLLKSYDSDIVYLTFILCSCFFFSAFDIIDLLFQSVLKSKYPAYVRTVAFVLLSIVKLGLIHYQFSFSAFVWAYVAEIGLACFGLIWIYSYKVGSISKWQISKSQVFLYVASSKIMILQSFAIVSQTKLDQIIVAQNVSENELGQYAVAMRMVDIILFLPMAIYASYAPKVAEAKIQSETIYQSKLGNLFSLLTWMSLLISIGMLLFGNWGIHLLFGDKFNFAGALFSISGFRLMTAFISIAKSVYYVNENMLSHSLYCLVAGAITNIGISIFLIPQIGAIGAIYANMIAFVISIVIVDLFNPKTRNQLYLYFNSLTKVSFK